MVENKNLVLYTKNPQAHEGARSRLESLGFSVVVSSNLGQGPQAYQDPSLRTRSNVYEGEINLSRFLDLQSK